MIKAHVPDQVPHATSFNRRAVSRRFIANRARLYVSLKLFALKVAQKPGRGLDIQSSEGANYESGR